MIAKLEYEFGSIATGEASFYIYVVITSEKRYTLVERKSKILLSTVVILYIDLCIVHKLTISFPAIRVLYNGNRFK